jgi:hypothetical protein
MAKNKFKIVLLLFNSKSATFPPPFLKYYREINEKQSILWL